MIDDRICSRRSMLAAAGAGWLALSPQEPAKGPARDDAGPALLARTLVFVRHTEKAKDEKDPAGPGLTERGARRASALAGMFAAAGVTATYATEFRRTQLTVAPLAASARRKVVRYASRDSTQFAEELCAPDSDAGALAVIAGHSNTVPQMVAAVGGHLSGLDDAGCFGEDEYDRVVIVQLCGAPGQRLAAVSTLDLRLEI